MGGNNDTCIKHLARFQIYPNVNKTLYQLHLQRYSSLHYQRVWVFKNLIFSGLFYPSVHLLQISCVTRDDVCVSRAVSLDLHMYCGFTVHNTCSFIFVRIAIINPNGELIIYKQ